MTTPLDETTGRATTRPEANAAEAAAWLRHPNTQPKHVPTQAEQWAAEPEWKEADHEHPE